MSRPTKHPLRLTQEQRKLVDQNRGLAHRMTTLAYENNTLARCWGTLEDLVQEGMVVLCRAAKNYEPERGIKFSTYACNAIGFELWKKLNYYQMIHVPEY